MHGVRIGICMAGLAVGMSAGAARVDSQAETEWARHLIPLPREISIAARIAVAPSDLTVVTRPGATPIERQAASELRELFLTPSSGGRGGSPFEIIIGAAGAGGKLGDWVVPAIERLKTLPNNNQAYVIQPLGESRLAVAGLDGRGVYYGVQTLKQLLGAYSDTQQVIVPIAAVVDWPAMAERGVWNAGPDLDWLAGLKLNFSRIMGRYAQPAQRGQKADFIFDVNGLEARQLRAFSPVVSFTHLNFINESGNGRWFEAYPELAGVGEKACQKVNPSPAHRVPCASNPLLIQILADAMRDAAAKGCLEFDVWQSEFISECECEKCRNSGKGQVGLESDAIAAAWRDVSRQHPDFNLRIFYSLADATSNTPASLKSLPSAVKVGYVYGPQAPFDDAARQGRWAAHWMVRANQGYETVKLKAFIQNLHSNHWQGAYGYSGGAFGLTALSEWAWNPTGRTERELAEAWAVRRKFANPAGAAAWVETIGPLNAIQFDYGVNSIIATMPQRIAERAKINHLSWIAAESNAAAARQSLALAEELKIQELADESRKSVAFYGLVMAICNLWNALNGDPAAPEIQDAAREAAMADVRSAALNYQTAYGSRARFGETWAEAMESAVKARCREQGAAPAGKI